LIGPNYNRFATQSLSSGAFADGFHTFTADWYPDHISFFVDGRLFNSQYRAEAGSGWVFDHPFYLVLDVAVGGNQLGDPDEATIFPQQLPVDWVHVYRAGPPAASVSGRITGLGGKCVEAAGTVDGRATGSTTAPARKPRPGRWPPTARSGGRASAWSRRPRPTRLRFGSVRAPVGGRSCGRRKRTGRW
jgi:beta-glucanase (GH16 family)